MQNNANVIGKSTKGFSISMASGDKRTNETKVKSFLIIMIPA